MSAPKVLRVGSHVCLICGSAADEVREPGRRAFRRVVCQADARHRSHPYPAPRPPRRRRRHGAGRRPMPAGLPSAPSSGERADGTWMQDAYWRDRDEVEDRR